MTHTSEIVISGGDIAGASAPAFLSATGTRAALLERDDQPGHHDTGPSTASYRETCGPDPDRRTGIAP